MKRLIMGAISLTALLATNFALADYPADCPSVAEVKSLTFPQYEFIPSLDIAGVHTDTDYATIMVKESSDDESKARSDAAAALASVNDNTVPTLVSTAAGTSCLFLGAYDPDPSQSTFPIVITLTKSAKGHLAIARLFNK